jgi:hypothetical protein
MMKKAKTAEKRVDSAIGEKQSLLKNIEIEEPITLNYQAVSHPKVLVEVQDLFMQHKEIVTPTVNFKLENHQVLALIGPMV